MHCCLLSISDQASVRGSGIKMFLSGKVDVNIIALHCSSRQKFACHSWHTSFFCDYKQWYTSGKMDDGIVHWVGVD